MTRLAERVRRDPGLGMLVLAMVGVIALYASTIGYGIVNYDDPSLYRDNWIVQTPSVTSLRAIWLELDGPHRITLSPEYLPVRDTWVMVEFAIWGDWWGGFHVTSLVVYLAAIVLWFAALVELGVDRRVAGLAMLLWALHPSHAESVAWLSERKGLLGVMFGGASALGYARFRAGRPVGWLVIALVAAVCAIWSKAIAAFLIAALAGLEIALPARRASWRRSLSGLGALAVVGGLAFVPVLYLAAHADVVGSEVKAPAGRIEMVVGVLGFYVRMGAMGLRNAIVYPLGSHGPSALELVLGAAAAGGLALLVAAPRRFAVPPAARAGAILWVVTWLPASHLVLPLQMVFVADRYALVPTLGLALVCAAAIVHARRLRDRVKQWLVAALVVASVLRTLDARANWRDDLTLWERAVTSDPDNGEAWSQYVQALVDAGATEAAERALDEGLARSPTPRLVMRKANLQLSRGERGAGVATMRAAAEAQEPRAMANLALLLLEDGNLTEALAWARRADGIPYAHTHRVHGKVALAAGVPHEALDAFRAAHALAPRDPQNQYNLALALIAVGRPNEALPLLVACARGSGAEAAACRAQLGNFERR